MEKLSELDSVINDLRTAAEAINKAADTLLELANKSSDVPKDMDKVAAPKITLDEVSRILIPIKRKSKEHSDKLRELIKKYGSDKLSAIDPKHYAAIIAEAEEIDNA